MAVFVRVEGDPFEGALEQASDRTTLSRGKVSHYAHVRRPVRGIQLKAPSFATLQVFTETLDYVGLYDAGGENDSEGGSWATQPATSNFLLQSVQRTQQEKFQLVETFGADYGFFYGQKPVFYSFSGVLMNTADFNWSSEWWANYDEVLRGTKLVERRARVYLTFDTIVLEGYVIQSSSQWDSNNPYHTPFSFSMWVTRWSDTSAVGHTDFPLVFGFSTDGAEEAAVTLEESLRTKIRNNLDEYLFRTGQESVATADPAALSMEATDDLEAATKLATFLDGIGSNIEDFPQDFVSDVANGVPSISMSSGSFFQTLDEINAGQTVISLPDTTVVEIAEDTEDAVTDLLDVLGV